MVRLASSHVGSPCFDTRTPHPVSLGTHPIQGDSVGLSQTRVDWNGAKRRFDMWWPPILSFLTEPLGTLCMPR